MRCILFLFVLVSICTAQQYITDITCLEDAECNKGECIEYNGGNFCKCDVLYYPKNIDGTNVPCVEPIGKVAPKAMIAFISTYFASMVLIFATHVSVIIALSASEKIKNKKIKSWQFDPRITLVSLAANCLFTCVFNGLLIQYAFGHSDTPRFNIVADFTKALYFEAGTAVIFYWFLAIQPTPAQAQSKARFPFLAISFLIFLIWWAISSFVKSDNDSVTNGVAYFHLALALIFLVSIVGGLFYYGRQILVILSPKSKSASPIVKKVAFFLFFAAFIIIVLFIFFILSMVLNEMNTVSGYIAGQLFVIMVIEWMIHMIFIGIFSGGSFQRMWRGIIWAWQGKNRSGKSPMDVDYMKGSSDASSADKTQKHASKSSGTSNKSSIVTDSVMTVV